MRSFLKLGILLLALVAGAAAQNQYFVATNGSNGNSGTTAGSPWLLISFAIANANLTGGATINVAAGTYTEAIGGCSGRTASICVNRNGPSTTVRFKLVCATAGGCLLRNGAVNGGITVVANNVDVQGFDYGNDANAEVGALAACTPSNLSSGNCGTGNSVHFINNFLHDLAQSVTDAGVVAGCPRFGAIYAGSQVHGTAYVNDFQAVGNKIVNYGSATVRVNGTCNEGHGIYSNTPNAFIANNIIVQVPTFGIQLYNQACNSAISNNTIDQPSKGGIVIANGTACEQGATGRVSINNNILEAGPGGGITLGSGGGSPCTGSSRVQIADNLIPPGMALTSGALNGCTDISGTITEAPATTFTSYSASSATNTYVLKTGSAAIANGTAPPGCVSGTTIPSCVPTLDFNFATRPNPPSVGALDVAGGGGGTGVGFLSPQSIDFGTRVPLQGCSAPQITTFTNTGTGNLTINTETLSAQNDFQFGGTGNCANGLLLPPQASCTVSGKFCPSKIGSSLGASVVVSHTAPNSPQTVTFTGIGANPAPPAGLTVTVQ